MKKALYSYLPRAPRPSADQGDWLGESGGGEQTKAISHLHLDVLIFISERGKIPTDRKIGCESRFGIENLELEKERVLRFAE